MGSHLHKRYDDEFVGSILQKYVRKELSVRQALDILQIKRSRFFVLVNKFVEGPNEFSITYNRKPSGRISAELETIIRKELQKEKELIRDKEIPVRNYNYSYIRDQIYKNNRLTVSLPTIIKRAKENGCYIPTKVRKTHDREVLTNYPGELLQHDSSYHKFSPYAKSKWYLITTIDDFSRYIYYMPSY